MRRILIIQTASLGDVILSTSLGETLHKAFPDTPIDFLIKDGYQSLFTGHPFINQVIVWKKSENKYANLIKIIKQVKAANYTAVINVHRFASSGIITALSGAKIRTGFSKNPLSLFYTKRIRHSLQDKMHEIERNYRLIRSFTGQPLEPPRLYSGPNDDIITGKLKGRPYLTISPASLYFTKQLPAHKWLGLIKAVMPNYAVYLLGSNADKELCESIAKVCDDQYVFNLAGRLSFLQSASLMKDAVMNYVNDSAPQHIASSVNAPVTAVFCSTVPSFGFGPLSDQSTIVETNEILGCKPCGIHGWRKCPLGHFKCAETISFAQLLLPLTDGRSDKTRNK